MKAACINVGPRKHQPSSVCTRGCAGTCTRNPRPVDTMENGASKSKSKTSQHGRTWITSSTRPGTPSVAYTGQLRLATAAKGETPSIRVMHPSTSPVFSPRGLRGLHPACTSPVSTAENGASQGLVGAGVHHRRCWLLQYSSCRSGCASGRARVIESLTLSL